MTDRRLKWLLAAGSLLLLSSLSVNILLAHVLYDSFRKLQLSHIFPLGFVVDSPARPGAEAKRLSERPSIGFWGDSRAYLWDLRSLRRQWAVANFAHGGQSSSQVLLQLTNTPAVTTTCSVVQVGINDIHPLGLLQPEKRQILANLVSNVIAIRDALLTRSDRVVLTTILPPAEVPLSRRLAWDPQALQLIASVNSVIRDAADGDRVRVLDANALLRDSGGYLQARYAGDDFFLHPNSAAYELLNREVSRLCALPVRQR